MRGTERASSLVSSFLTPFSPSPATAERAGPADPARHDRSGDVRGGPGRGVVTARQTGRLKHREVVRDREVEGLGG